MQQNLPTPSSQKGVVDIYKNQSDIQAMLTIAQNFPRNVENARKEIAEACKIAKVAEKGLYSYSRGGTPIEGASIRLLEVVAQAWGNLKFGITETEVTPARGNLPGESKFKAFAWDLQKNTYSEKEFSVRHTRSSGGSVKNLTDERDVYEATANFATRRMRAEMERVIPTYIIEEAEDHCRQTIADNEKNAGKGKTEAQMNEEMAAAFSKFSVTREMIAKLKQKNFEAINAQDRVSLRVIYNSLKDGVAKVEDIFKGEVIEAQHETLPQEAPPAENIQKTPPPAKQEAPPKMKNYAPQTQQEAEERAQQPKSVKTEVVDDIPSFDSNDEPPGMSSKPKPKNRKEAFDLLMEAGEKNGFPKDQPQKLQDFAKTKNIDVIKMWQNNDVDGILLLRDIVIAEGNK